MSQIYEATIINFKRNKGKDGSIELRVKIDILSPKIFLEKGESVFFYSQTLTLNVENPWIDWNKQNSQGEPALKIRGGQVVKFQGELKDMWSSKELIGELLNDN